MAYNLPPPWDAGYALPQNVKDEGLENRGFVTKMLPRGTYDNPKVGTGGYAVPSYVKQEQPGQGTYVTKWLPRGTAPNVPHYLDRRPQVVRQQSLGPRTTKVTLNGLGATAMPAGAPVPALHAQFGKKAAARILGVVAKMPVANRAPAFRMMIDRIDPTLAARIGGLQKQGVSLPDALAQALAVSYGTSVVSLGRKSIASSQARPLQGLGGYISARYGGDASALGTTAAQRAGVTGYNPNTGTISGAAVQSTDGIHQHVDITPIGFVPDATKNALNVGPFLLPADMDASNVYGYRIGTPDAIGESWRKFLFDAMSPNVRTDSEPNAVPTAPDFQWIPPNPTVHKTTADLVASTIWRQSGEQWRDASTWMNKIGFKSGTWAPSNPCARNDIAGVRQLPDGLGSVDVTTAGFAACASVVGGDLRNIRGLVRWHPKFMFASGADWLAPLALFNHPKTGKKWGVFYSLDEGPGYWSTTGAPSDPMTDIAQANGKTFYWKNSGPPNIVPSMTIWFAQMPIPGDHWYDFFTDILDAIGDAIIWLPTKLVEGAAWVADNAYNVISDIVCDIAGSAVAPVAGAVVSTYVGAGPATGVAGAQIAKDACGNPIPPPPTPDSGVSTTTLLLIGGVVAGAAVYLYKKKKHHS